MAHVDSQGQIMALDVARRGRRGRGGRSLLSSLELSDTQSVRVWGAPVPVGAGAGVPFITLEPRVE